MQRTIKWAYGVTTVVGRLENTLPRTLASLVMAGFDKPTLFVDGLQNANLYDNPFCLTVVCRYPIIRAFGNWVLALAELYIRNPKADRYLLFQDDLVTYRNLRQYLESIPYPDNGYCNFYTFPHNQLLATVTDKAGNKRERFGFYPSDNMGKGALGLMFDRPTVTSLLTFPTIINKPQNALRGYRNIDGAVVEALKQTGRREYVHNPSLVQHTGDISAIGNKKHPKAVSFRGEEFNALELLNEDH